MKKLSLILLTLLVSHYGVCQLTNLQNIANGTPLTANNPDVSGNPYFTDFVAGEVLLANGSVFGGLIRYNSYTNELEYKEGFDVFTLEERQVQNFKITIDGKQKVFEKGLYRPANANLFYERLAENNGMTLIKVYTSAIGQDSNASSYGSVMGKAFIQSMTVFLCSNDDCSEVKNNKSLIASLPEEKQDEAAELIKKEKLNLKKEDDAIYFIQTLP
ncbi:hypothetical protein SAMN04489724_1384 [Algoriphagus locisalis]|uniref:Uncharacterized protein n=1 Tax=Algoriphagus locisalis TaxID=305507 RepID=A0A1I6ZP96_9BACT|nr:hypothetical protein [Algoriphagus locisalis]SFT64462.1 hypothetical protein SAMN04489724_1384 [Algoriphagus locisalis]